ncbi:hypothetical protein QFZ62_000348 [Clavibacter sp. B3I6]|uniref:WxL domain-containing protein n=1 Tax=Clavibacter sp. B3I6 TaxID=3042268 RepID=UPI002787FCBF|nr:WxL domain-containing protein [Clavibacter sp. B3I6]MDQ0743040.1 hypothetical protein [Clavibacter sp. B3I6]
MRTHILPIAGTAATLLLVLGIANPAAAATDGGTPVSVEVVGGALSITVPAATVSLGSVNESSSAQTVSAALGLVTVSDYRGGNAGWTVSASANDFTGPQNISVNGATTSGYDAPEANTVGVVTVAPSDLAGLYPGGAVQTATNVAGANSASWSPTISLGIPAGTLAGTYSTILTHSVN